MFILSLNYFNQNQDLCPLTFLLAVSKSTFCLLSARSWCFPLFQSFKGFFCSLSLVLSTPNPAPEGRGCGADKDIPSSASALNTVGFPAELGGRGGRMEPLRPVSTTFCFGDLHESIPHSTAASISYHFSPCRMEDFLHIAVFT